MAIRMTMFSDDEDNQMSCFINEENKVMIIVNDLTKNHQNYIKFDKEDIEEVISVLNELSAQLNNVI